MHLSAPFMRTLIPFIHFLFALAQHNKPYLVFFIYKELNVDHNDCSFKKCLVLYVKLPMFFYKLVFIVSITFYQIFITTPFFVVV